MINACKILNKKYSDLKVIINGGGAAGLSICELLLELGVKDIIICDTKGAIYKGRKENMNKYKDLMANMTNLNLIKGSLEEVIKNTDFFYWCISPKNFN